jgi:hypothetical protein
MRKEKRGNRKTNAFRENPFFFKNMFVSCRKSPHDTQKQ